MSLSQSDRILLVLMDGGWHSTRSILREVPSIVHSRISDLRKTGLTIEHRTVGVGAAGSEYRLLGSPGSKATETAAVAAAPGDPNSSPLSGDEPWQQPHPGRDGRSESPALLPDTRPLVSSSPLSGGPLTEGAGGVEGFVPQTPRLRASAPENGATGQEVGLTAPSVSVPGAPLVAGANQGPFNQPPVMEVQERAGSQPVGASRPRPFSLGNDNGRNIAGGWLSGASAQAGWEGHGRPSDSGCEPGDPSGSPPAQLPLPGVAA